ncbi:MAG: hypothetical protein JW993_06250, partial [Sedimentisphaerales bacterium]|nr:hypothetical protein [Sedimentisphaerales bacterium]
QDIQARFRVAGKEAELWHPDTGEIELAEYSTADNLTTVPLNLAQRKSVFVVFRRAASAPSRALPPRVAMTLATLIGSWEVHFPTDLGGPGTIELAELGSWADHAEEGVKYFSGTATYTKTLQVAPDSFQEGATLWLDLGAVRDLAEVCVNGKTLGTLWKEPYRIDITGALKPGANQLEIKVTNQWTNRIAGDRTVPADRRVLSQSSRGGFGGFGGFGGRGQRLAESGLLGPVTLVSQMDQ